MAPVQWHSGVVDFFAVFGLDGVVTLERTNQTAGPQL